MKRFLSQLIPYIILVTLAFTFTWTVFSRLGVGEFIFSGDQLLRLSYEEAFGNSFFLRKMDHLGVFNSWQQIVQIWDETYYLITYWLGLSLLSIEKLSFFLTLSLSLSLSYAGLRRVFSLFHRAESPFLVGVVSVWYCFNPYTLILWHGGVYNLGLAITYSLAPFIFYYFHLALFGEGRRKDKVTCALLMFLASFTFWLFAALVFFLGLYFILFLILRRPSFKAIIKNLFHLSLLYLPMASFILFALYHEHAHNLGDLNATFTPSFGSQQGGLWYQFLMLFSWGIYTVWTPRSLYPFGQYFWSWPYILSTLSIYGLVLWGIISLLKEQCNTMFSVRRSIRGFWKEEKNISLVIFLFLLFISVFFAKGAQDPLGEMFLFFYNYVPFFSVFRSADHRFGFAVVLSLAFLLLFVARKIPIKWFCGLLVTLTFFQSLPLFSGSAMLGKNIEGEYFDRITHIAPEYQEVADLLNKQPSSSGYILSLPPIEYGHYILDSEEKEHHIGQDLLPKLIRNPFVYISPSTGMSSSAAASLQKSLEKGVAGELARYPINYVIVRRDIACTDCLNSLSESSRASFELLGENNLFAVYKIPQALPLVDASDATFRMINPVKFQVDLKNVREGDPLHLMLSYSEGWKVFLNRSSPLSCHKEEIRKYIYSQECVQSQKFFEGDEWRYLFASSLFDFSHSVKNGYANTWKISTEFIRENYPPQAYSLNQDGSMNVSFIIYYQPQSWYYLFAFFTLLSLATGFALTGRSRKKPPRPKTPSHASLISDTVKHDPAPYVEGKW